MTPRIYADFNYCDPEGRLILNTRGSLKDIAEYMEFLQPGLRIVVYMDDEFEVEATLLYDGTWLATPHLETLRYL